jgi:competence protein ComEC
MRIKNFTVLLFCLCITNASRAGIAEKTLDIYWADVEGGAATLIVTPKNESVLIDTGEPGGRDSGRIHEVATKIAGLKKIDYLITTHFHIDHFGGAAELARLMPIGTVYDNGIPDRNPDNNPADTRFPLLIKPYREMKADKRAIINVDEAIPLHQSDDQGVSKVTLRCIAARQSFTRRLSNHSETNSICAELKLHDKDITDNANSVVMLLEFGDFRFFDGGDLTWNMEGQLVCPINLAGKVDVYQVNHHGLDLSNNPLLVRALSPKVTVMSNGINKGCNAGTFATLKSIPSIEAMYQIHRNLRADSENNTSSKYIANLEQHCNGDYIKLSVAPNGKSYTISIPAKGHSATYKTVAGPSN